MNYRVTVFCFATSLAWWVWGYHEGKLDQSSIDLRQPHSIQLYQFPANSYSVVGTWGKILPVPHAERLQLFPDCRVGDIEIRNDLGALSLYGCFPCTAGAECNK